ncbi:DUF6401 family natural product biosynthesis protein [Nocardia sp. CDC159]|uniref:DUF6401 family natural product biosynthesis protein n=1 Tax=Nocardia pulmonis TaxID=2951408 RepID=A0A9X2IZ33_9NOCA|nr:MULTISPECIES: DUF6401 family natural product biosynthesis protein [Nocardia]MCM6777083.1 DUF6401 family natural product biosynthesis protein [Nocardia pulmonis]MCM6789968.1 DUF6401 family natural product biosynthesis protein [Nocardia sp. CDC159]
MFLLGSALLEVSARKTLTRLHKTHGVPAQAAAREIPAVSAALDQHAAAVRDILELGVENSAAVPVSVLLAGYARGLLEHSGRAALRTPQGSGEWCDADWLQLRLAGVCLLAGIQA